MDGYIKSKTALVLVDIQQPFYSKNDQIKSEFPDFANNVTEALKYARANGIKVVHIRAVYSEEKSPWISTFRKMNPEKWDWLVHPL